MIKNGILKRMSQKRDVSGLWIETVVLLIFFVGYWYFIYQNAGGPTNWDELLYMDLGLNPRPDGHILNRWMHIYFQKLFLEIAPNPIQGAKLYWGFLLSVTTVLVYLIGKSLTEKSNKFNGVAAALFFSSSPSLFEEAGVTYADYTVMFFVALGIWLYISFFSSTNRFRWLLLVAYGFVLFSAFKSKETGVILLVPWLGFAFEKQRFNWRFFLRNSLLILLGISLGFGVLFWLDAKYIGDAWFSLSSEAAGQYSAFALRSESVVSGFKDILYRNYLKIVYQIGRPVTRQWVELLLWRLPVLIALYLSGLAYLVWTIFKGRKKLGSSEVFIWLLPLCFLLLLTFARRGPNDRHFFPMHAVLALLAAQFFIVTLPFDVKSVWKKVVQIVKSPKVLLTAFILGLYAVYKSGPEFERVYSGFIVGMSGVGLIVMSIWTRRWTALASAVALVGVFLYSFYGIVYDNLLPLASGKVVAETTARFGPFEEIRDDFECRSTTQIYISAVIHREFDTVGRTASSNPWFFNVLFDCKLTSDQIQFSKEANLPSDIVSDQLFTYVFLTANEYNALDPMEKVEIEVFYVLKYFHDDQLVFLTDMDSAD